MEAIVKITQRAEGPTVIENEVTAATKALISAIYRVGPGELKDAEKEILAEAVRYPRDRDLCISIVTEIRARRVP